MAGGGATAVAGELEPATSGALVGDAAAYAERGDFTNALAAYRAALRVEPESLSARLGHADTRYRRGEYGAALAEFASIASANPGHPVAHHMLGLIHARRGASHEAIVAQRQAIAADASYSPARYQLGVLLAGAGEWDAARASLQEALRLEPHMPEAYYQLARLLRRQGDLEQASAMMRRFRVENDHVERMQRLRETLLAGDEQDRTSALVGLGLFHIEREEFDAAERRLTAALPEPEAYAGLGRVALEREQYADAVASYARAFELAFDAPQARYHTAVALMQQGDGERAMSHLRAAIEADPAMAEAHLLLGTLYAARRDIPPAVTHYERAIALAPEDPVARHSLGYLLGREGLELPRAVSLTRDATRLEPTSALYHNTLSWLLLQLGDHDAAERAVRRAIELEPENAVYRAGLDAVRQARRGGARP